MRKFAITVAIGAALVAQGCAREGADTETAETTTPGAVTDTDQAALPPTSPEAGMQQTAAGAGQLSPQTFVSRATNANMLEIEASRVALERTQNAQVREYAQRMVNDHTKVGAQMQELAPQLNVTVPQSLDAPMQGQVQTLRTADAAGFDRAYVDLMVSSHRDAVELFTQAAGSQAAGARSGTAATGAGGARGAAGGGTTGSATTPGGATGGAGGGGQTAESGASQLPQQLQQFAANTLPTLRQHLEQAQQLQGRISGQGQTGGTTPRT